MSATINSNYSIQTIHSALQRFISLDRMFFKLDEHPHFNFFQNLYHKLAEPVSQAPNGMEDENYLYFKEVFLEGRNGSYLYRIDKDKMLNAINANNAMIEIAKKYG